MPTGWVISLLRLSVFVIIIQFQKVMQLQIRVFSGISAMESNNRLFERIIEVHDDISVPYSSLISDMKFLFGSSCIVSFNVM